MATVIPGALADYLTGQTIADADTADALDAARRGRGRTLVIEPTSTRVLHVISAYAEAILENRALHTPAEVRAARLWIQRAGHAVPTPAAAVDLAETVEQADAVQAVTEAEASEGTWRGAWIGEQPAGDALFAVDPAVEQGALFDGRPVREPVVVRASFHRADLDRIKAKADADRAAYRAETDDRIAAECAAHGVAPSQGVRDRIAARAAEQAPARRVIEGVIVGHAGTAEGSTPEDAGHPNVIAARAALAGLAAARMTDHHDVSEPTAAEQDVRGYLINPRGGDRVAVYWLESGRMIRRDTPNDGAALDCLAYTLTRQGWTVETMLKSSQCVFAHRPAD
ncbi:hypothetical protein [Streptomyces sp. NPDC048256]|uniref:hypothetical protein n=1 Tax=Streptomyces sp. NPDC048256 TaxID=3154613 RepID=UPI0033D0E4C2